MSKIVPQGTVTIEAKHYFEILRRVERLENMFKLEMPYSMEPRTYEQNVNLSFSPNDAQLLREIFNDNITDEQRARLEAAGFELKDSEYSGYSYVQPSKGEMQDKGIYDRVMERVNADQAKDE